jgi:hypothetical protein
MKFTLCFKSGVKIRTIKKACIVEAMAYFSKYYDLSDLIIKKE